MFIADYGYIAVAVPASASLGFGSPRVLVLHSLSGLLSVDVTTPLAHGITGCEDVLSQIVYCCGYGIGSLGTDNSGYSFLVKWGCERGNITRQCAGS